MAATSGDGSTTTVTDAADERKEGESEELSDFSGPVAEDKNWASAVKKVGYFAVAEPFLTLSLRQVTRAMRRDAESLRPSTPVPAEELLKLEGRRVGACLSRGIKNLFGSDSDDGKAHLASPPRPQATSQPSVLSSHGPRHRCAAERDVAATIPSPCAPRLRRSEVVAHLEGAGSSVVAGGYFALVVGSEGDPVLAELLRR
jgi:hypothetical protein